MVWFMWTKSFNPQLTRLGFGFWVPNLSVLQMAGCVFVALICQYNWPNCSLVYAAQICQCPNRLAVFRFMWPKFVNKLTVPVAIWLMWPKTVNSPPTGPVVNWFMWPIPVSAAAGPIVVCLMRPKSVSEANGWGLLFMELAHTWTTLGPLKGCYSLRYLIRALRVFSPLCGPDLD